MFMNLGVPLYPLIELAGGEPDLAQNGPGVQRRLLPIFIDQVQDLIAVIGFNPFPFQGTPKFFLIGSTL